MTIGVGGSAGGLDTRNLDLTALFEGDVTAQSSTMMTVYEGDGFTAHFTGVGVAYDVLGRPAAGTITGISEDYLGISTFSLTQVNVSASQFYHWVETNDAMAAKLAILGGDDTLTGTIFDDYLEGFGGHDYLAGGSGADTLVGSDGNDHLYGQSAIGGADAGDSLIGGDGSDYLQGNAGNDTIDGGAGSDRINGGADNDLIMGGIGIGSDTINGNRGNDTIDGGDGDDSLRGGQDNDSITGGNGNDILSGDKGVDVLTGGAGNDQFRFAAGDAAIVSDTTDKITDYVHGSDHLALGFNPAALLTGATQASLAAAQSAAQSLFDGHGGDHEVAAIQVGSDTYVFFGGAAGNVIDSAVMLQGITSSTITVSDFV